MVGWLANGELERKWSWPNQYWHLLKWTEKTMENLGQGTDIMLEISTATSTCSVSFKFLAFTVCSRVNVLGIWHFVTSHNADTGGCHSGLKCNIFTSGGKFLKGTWLSHDTE